MGAMLDGLFQPLECTEKINLKKKAQPVTQTSIASVTMWLRRVEIRKGKTAKLKSVAKTVDGQLSIYISNLETQTESRD